VWPGILFYVFMLCLSIANIVVINVLPADLIVVLTPLGIILYSSLAMRIILDIRYTDHGGALQTAQETMTSLQFCSIGYTGSSHDMAGSEGFDGNSARNVPNHHNAIKVESCLFADVESDMHC